MPIVLPNLGAVASTDPMPMVSGSDAAAPWEALGSLADGIGQVGKVAGGIGKQMQEVDNAADITEVRNKLSESRSKFEQSLLEDPDYRNYGARLNAEVIDPAREFITPDMSPAVRQQLTQEIANWATDARIHTDAAANRRRVERAAAGLQNARQIALDTGDDTSYLRLRAEHKYRTPEENAADDRDLSEQLAARHAEMDIQRDPGGWLENNKQAPDKPGDFLRWNAQRDLARQQLGRHTADAVDDAADLMAQDKLVLPEQVDQFFGKDLRPAAREKLKNIVIKRQQAKEEARLATPEYQRQVVGRVSALLADYNPQAEGFDADYAEIGGLIATLPESPTRTELQRNLSDAKENVLKEITTAKGLAEKVVMEAYKANRFGRVDLPGTISQSMRSAIDDGFLTDQGKLQRLGYTSAQAKEIAEGKDESKRLASFRTLFSQRAGTANVSPLEWETAKAIRDGKTASSMVEVADPEAEDEAITQREAAQAKLGKILIDLQDFAAANPKATRGEYENEVYRLAGEEVRQQMKQKLITPAPSTSRMQNIPGADPSTSSLPQGRNLTDMVKHFEAGGAAKGYHPAAYWDYGQWSIGYGTKSKEGETITQAEAERRLATELNSARADVTAEAGRLGIAFTPQELDALTSFQFNTGRISQLLANGTRSKPEIAAKMLLYRNAKGERLLGLERRRQAESYLFQNGFPGGYGNRPDGTPKGSGWLGEIKLPDGGVATEYTMQSNAVKIDGKRIDFPTLVPTLTKEELDLMRTDIIPNKKDIPETIIQKAIAHAKAQIAKGESVFAEH